MITVFHKTAGGLLFLFHSLFLLRSAILLKREAAPSKADRIFMTLSQVLLPIAILTGLPLIARASLFHIIPGLMPVVMMFILSRRSIRRRYPLLLPGINWLFITAAMLTGVFL